MKNEIKINGEVYVKIENLSAIRYILAVRELGIADSKAISKHLNVDSDGVFSVMKRLEKIGLVNIVRKRQGDGLMRAFYRLSEEGEEF